MFIHLLSNFWGTVHINELQVASGDMHFAVTCEQSTLLTFMVTSKILDIDYNNY